MDRCTGRLRPRLRSPSSLAAAVALLALPAVVGAGRLHTELKSSEPAADAVVAESPARIVLTYTTDVQLALSSASVHPSAADSPAVPAGTLRYLADDRHDVLVLPLPQPPGAGGHIVKWATAGPDGHPISGDFGFRVGLPAGETLAEAAEGEVQPGDPLTPPADAGAEGQPQADAAEPGSRFAYSRAFDRFGLYVGILGVLGAVAFRFLVLGSFAGAGASQKVVGTATDRAQLIGGLGLGVLAVLLPLRLLYQAATFFPDDIFGNMFAVAAGTPWAAGWWLQFVSVVLVAGGLLFARKRGARPTGWKIVALGALLLPLTPVLSGHGWSDSPRGLSAAATYLHVMAAGGWMGGLVCLLFAGIPALRGQDSEAAPGAPGIAEMVGAFSRVAQVAVGVLLATGALKVWIHIGTLSELWTTPWGRSLLVKDLIVAGVLLLGLYHWRVVRPRLERGVGSEAFKRSAVAELLLGTAAVIVTAILVAQPLR